MMPLRTGPTMFFAFSPTWWQALHTTKTFSPAAASCARASPAPTIANTAAKTTARISSSHHGCGLMTELAGRLHLLAGRSMTRILRVSMLWKAPRPHVLSFTLDQVRPGVQSKDALRSQRLVPEICGSHGHWSRRNGALCQHQILR